MTGTAGDAIFGALDLKIQVIVFIKKSGWPAITSIDDMATQLQKHPRYWRGMEHSFFTRALKHALTQGVQGFVEGTDRRRAWFQDSAHLFPDFMLVGCFAYLEGQLGQGWIEKYGRKHKRDLYCMRLIRNAIVHKSGDLKKCRHFSGKNINAKRGRPSDINAYVVRYALALKKRNIKDDKGKPIPVYFTVSNGLVKLNNKAFGVLLSFCVAIYRRAGLTPIA